jgi:hypothetical protein
MSTIITPPGAPRLDWVPMSDLACRMARTPDALAFVAQTYDGTWQPIALLRGPDGTLRTGPLWIGEPAVARHGAQRLAERVIAEAKDDPETGNGSTTVTGRNWCRECGGVNACLSWCPKKSGR